MTVATSPSLSPIELAWLRVGTPENLSVNTVALVCDGHLDPAAIKTRIEDRLLPEERFRQRIEISHLPLARPRWCQHDRFQLSDHFSHIGLIDGEPPAVLAEVIGKLCSQPLDEKLPLWHIHLADLEEDRSVLVFRLHASVADSTAAAALALRLVDANESPPSAGLGLEDQMPLHDLRNRAGSTAKATRMLCQLITSRADRKKPFRLQPTDSKTTEWSQPVDLSTVEDRVSQNGSSIAAELLAAVTGALRKAVHRQDIPAENMNLRAVVSLSLRQSEDPIMGTRTALGLLHLPLHAATPAARLEAVQREIERFSLTPESLAILAGDSRSSLSMTEVEERSLRLLGQKASASLGFVDGPDSIQHLCGQPVSQFVWWPAVTGPIALAVSLVAYAGQVRFGVSCDESLPIDAATLSADMADGLTES